MIRWMALVACVLLSSVALASGPEGIYSFRNYGSEQGLRNEAVTSLSQDRTGFLYVGTEDGLFRYDGERFLRLGIAEGLPSDSITVLHATRQGSLWVATQKGLVAWTGVVSGSPKLKVFLPDKEVLGIASSDAGHLLVSTTVGTFEGNEQKLQLTPGMPHQAGAAWISPTVRSSCLPPVAGSIDTTR